MLIIQPVKNNKQKAIQLAKYKEYLSKCPKPKNRLSNLFNLFDDRNVIDRIIFKRTVGFIHQA